MDLATLPAPLIPPSLFLTDKIKMDEPNQNQLKNTDPLYIVFEVLKVL